MLATRLDPRRNALNAIRLVLALAVIVSHSWALGGYGAEPAWGGATLGTWAVYGFFGISGLLITASRLGSDAMSYLKRRFLRIYPGFVVCLVLTAAVFAPLGYLAAHHTLRGYLTAAHSPVHYVLSNLGLRMSFWDVSGTPTGVPYRAAWDGSLWSLYYEFLCYLLIGVVGWWAAFRSRPAVAVAMLATATTASIEQTAVLRVAQSYDVRLLVQLLPYFLAGCVLTVAGRWIPAHWSLAAGSLLVLVYLPAFAPERYLPLCALPLAYLLTWLGALLPVGIGRRNDISYGMYIYGFPVQQLCAMAGLTRLGHLAYLAFSVAIVVPFAAASWLFVERPVLARSRQSRRPVLPRTEQPEPVLAFHSQ